MPSNPNIVLFSVHKDAMDAAVRAFRADWPEARISNLMDDGLFTWVREAGGVVPQMYDAFRTLTGYMVSRGADGILFTCSAFREVIDTCIAEVPLPILGPNSLLASRALLAAQRQGKYAELHDALLKLKEEPTEPVLKREAEKLGLDWARLRREMDDPAIGRRLEANTKLAAALRIEGTPALIIGDTLVPGAVDLATLEKLVAEAREKRGG
jgi:hypothetical protein